MNYSPPIHYNYSIFIEDVYYSGVRSVEVFAGALGADVLSRAGGTAAHNPHLRRCTL